MSDDIDEQCLVIRNFPASFTDGDIREFLQLFDVTQHQIFIEYQAAIAEFKDKEHARSILSLLHQERLEKSRLFVEYAPKNRNHRLKLFSEHKTIVNQSNSNNFNGNATLKRLYATADGFDLEQPPPPYLYYEYPKINRDIIDSICIALEVSPTFYIQVLHLMNRMNLDPPFVAGDKSLNYKSSAPVQLTTVSTQTDEIMWQNLIRNKRKCVESDESELETSSATDSETDAVKQKAMSRPDKGDLIKRKQRKLLKMQRLQTEHVPNEKPINIEDAFDVNPSMKLTSQIKMIIPHEIKAPVEQMDIESSEITETEPQTAEVNIEENRIPADQLKSHPLFQNYIAGPISNCLYIKNIAKEVTEDDLRAIYNRYLEKNCNGKGNIRSIDIRLMTTGRMRGQCFVTFDGPYLNFDEAAETSAFFMVEKALRETNGLIVKNKPLVVVYGKGKSNKS